MAKNPVDLLHSPVIMSRFHASATVVWVVLLPISIFTPLKDSVPWLVAISVWALIGAHLAAYQGARSEIEAKKSNGDSSGHRQSYS